MSPRSRRLTLSGLLVAALLFCCASSVWAAAMVVNGGFPSPNVTWSLGSALNGVASVSTAQNHNTLTGTGSFLEAITGKNKPSSGTATQSVTITAGSVITNKTDVVAWAMEQWTIAASTVRTITIDLRYSDATTVNIFTGTVGANSAWTNVTNTTATVFPLTLAKNVNQITVTLTGNTGNSNGATSNIYVDDIAITYTPATIDSLTVTSNTPIATTAIPGVTNIQMQRLQLNSDATGNGNCVLSSATVEDVNVSTTGTISNLKVHVDNDTNFTNGVLGTATVATWDGESRVVDLTAISAANRTITNGTPKYLWVTYDIDAGAANLTTAISRITAIGLVVPDNAPLGGPWESNSILITAGLGCGGCHPLPVLDGASRSGATGAVVGNHTTHGTTFAYQCNTCHIEGSQVTGGTYTSRHRRGTIEMNVSGIGAVANARYDKNTDHVADTTWNQTGTPALGKCENTACHGGVNSVTSYGGPTGVGPTWGGNASADPCTFCHNSNKTNSGGSANAYPTAASPFRSANAAAAHLTHLTLTSNLINGGVLCVDCHNLPGTVNAAGHIDTNVTAPADVPFPVGSKALLNSYAAAYTPGGLTCNVYCHGAAMPKGDTSGTNEANTAWTANWTTYVPGTSGTCTAACHGLPPTTGSALSISSHSGQAFPATCKNCHGDTVTTTTNPPTIVMAKHINGTVEASGCNGCHGNTGSNQIWPMNSGADDGATTANINGAHELHMAWLAFKVYSESIATLLTDNGNGTASAKQQNLCTYCHSIGDSDHMGATVADVFKTTTLTAAAPKMYQTGAVETGTLGTFETTGNTCSNVDCHAQYGTAAAGSEPVTTPNWYNAPTHTFSSTTMNCAACHNNPSLDTAGKHTNHLNAATNFGLTVTCARCHDGATVWGAPGTIPAANHLNGTFNVTGTVTMTYGGTFRTSFGSCGTNTCHRSDASANTAPAQTTYAWGTTMANCSICHLEAMATNKHNEHLISNSLPNATNVNECFNCHNLTATSGGLATGANHINGADDLNFATTMNYEAATAGRAAGTGATTTCSNVKCHAGVTTPQWSLTVTCVSCHNTSAAGPLPSAASVAGEHAAHANNDADYTDCANCHASATSYTATGGVASHQNLTVDISMPAGMTYTDTANTAGGVNYAAAGATHIDDGTCSFTAGCHGTSGSAGWATASTLTNGCFACHGGGLAATETGTAKPAIDTTPNPVTYTGQYATYGHGLSSAGTYPGGSTGANLTSYSGTASPGCYSCHDSAATHSPAASATDPFRLGAYASNVEGLCLKSGCHDSPAILTHKKSVVGGTTTWVNNYDFKCVDCHDPHGDTNYYMVRSHISAPIATNDTTFGSDTYGTPADTANISAITFNSLAGGTTAGSYGVNTATNGICEVCHIDTTEVAYYRRGVNETNTHNPSGKCTSCHAHSEGFKGAGCTGCHGGDNATLTNKNYWPSGAGGAWPDRVGEHDIHVTRLALKLYSETLAQIVTDTGTTSDVKQKAICSYCHGAVGTIGASGHDTNNAPAGQADVGSFLRIYSGAADAGTAGTYTSPNCMTVDCHNEVATNANGTFGWYAAATSQCIMCHTRSTTGNNPSSGLHYGSTAPTVSAKWHDNTLNGVTADCLPCHTMPAYSAAGTHINGAFTGDGTIANPDRTAMGLFAAYTATANGVGSCSGSAVNTGCHDDAGDAGTWARKWDSTIHYVSTGNECKGCHGGFAETDWTFGITPGTGVGQLDNTTDTTVSHNRDWDGATAGEVIGFHTGTTATTACVSCHVYGDAAYVMGTHHRNGSIEMNSSVGYASATWNCTGSCHAVNTNHNLEDSGITTVVALAGPAPACTGCHNGTGTNNQFEVSATSSHTDPDGTGATYAAGGNHCAVCHFASHATETTNTIGVIWDTRTMGTSYVSGDGKIHLKNNIGGNVKTYEAQVCWGCHWDVDVTSLPAAIKEFGPTQGAYTTGSLTATPTSTGNWFAATWTSANFAYKTAAINSMHQAVADLDTTITIDTAHVATDVGTIGCTSCHDVHRVGMNGFTPAAAPYLRGSWTSNPFKEDGAPLSTGQTITSNRGAVPRGIDGTAANGYGGWQIEQNNATFTNTTYAGTSGYAGICANCHTQAALEALTWTGHDGAVSGFTGNTNNDLHTEAKRGGTTSWTRGYMSYNSVTTYRSSTWVGGLRNNRQWSDGINPRDIDSLQTGTPITYPAGAVTTITATGYQNNFHNFPCSKCHSPHASRLPRLMITNCLDVSKNTWDNALNPSGWAAADTHTAGQLAYSSTAQNCHRYVATGDATAKEPGQVTGASSGWNTVTPW